MPTINFTVTSAFNKMVDKAIKEKGYSSKAEFFRIAGLKEANPSVSRLSLKHLQGALREVGKRVTQKEIDKAIKQVRSK